MSMKRIFPERGTYDVTPSVPELQQRCNQLTNVITTTAEITPGYNRSSTPCTSQPQPQQEEMPATSTCPLVRRPSTSPSSSTEMIPRSQSMRHVDSIVEAPSIPNNIGFHSFEMDRKRRDADTQSVGSTRSSKCENCVVDCLYYTNECCDCTIV